MQTTSRFFASAGQRIAALRERQFWQIDIILLIALPIAVTVINPNWLFTQVINDNWFYHGYFYFLPAYLKEHAGLVYSPERLTWIGPGWILYGVLPFAIANFVLHFSIYYTSVFSVYFTLRSIYNRRAGFLAAVAMGTYPWFILAAGWDYVDGAGIAYVSLSVLLLTRAAMSASWRRALVWAGVLWCCAFVTNVMWAVFLPGLGLGYLVLNHHNRKNDWRASLAYFLAGSFAVLALLGALFLVVTGKPFLGMTFNLGAGYLSATGAYTATIASAGYYATSLEANAVVVLLLIADIGYLGLCRMRGITVTLLQKIFIFQFALAYLGYLFCYFVLHMPLLFIFLYISYLIPFAFLALGSILADRLATLSEKQFNWLMATGFFAMLAPLFLSTVYPQIADARPYTAAWLGAGVCGILMVSWPRAKWQVLLGGLGIISAVGFWGGAETLVYSPDRYQGMYLFDAVDQSLTVIRQHSSDPSNTFWLQPGRGTDKTYTRRLRTALYNYHVELFHDVTFSRSDYNAPGSKLTAPKNGDRVILLSPNRDALAAINQRLYPDVLVLNDLVHIQNEGYDIYLFFTTLQASSG